MRALSLGLPALLAIFASCAPSPSGNNGGPEGAASSAGQSSSGATSGSTGESSETSAASGSSSGSASASGSSGQSGSSGTSGSPDASSLDGGATPDCSTAMPTGGTTYTGTNVNGKSDGLNYGIWTNGSGGSITVFPSARAFSASWDNSSDFLAHLGLDYNGSKSYTSYGTITAQFAESKTGTSGSFSSIGIYGWTHSPCVEWYINEDSFTGLRPRGSVTATIDGATYYLTTSTTTGTNGANACEAGHTGGWTNMTSTRATARQCGTVTVSDHFKAWAAQGWSVGNLASVHINVEVGGGTGSIQFPVADVTTTSN
jgi:endo-1,4-beta-xylanase